MPAAPTHLQLRKALAVRLASARHLDLRPFLLPAIAPQFELLLPFRDMRDFNGFHARFADLAGGFSARDFDAETAEDASAVAYSAYSV
jgi:hypothetical protein